MVEPSVDNIVWSGSVKVGICNNTNGVLDWAYLSHHNPSFGSSGYYSTLMMTQVPISSPQDSYAGETLTAYCGSRKSPPPFFRYNPSTDYWCFVYAVGGQTYASQAQYLISLGQSEVGTEMLVVLKADGSVALVCPNQPDQMLPMAQLI